MSDIKKLLESLDRIVESSDINYDIGDPVIITGNVQFKGQTGDVVQFGQDKKFVVVDLYNYGKHSFHSSDVSYNDHADQEDDDDLKESFRKEFEQYLAEAELKKQQTQEAVDTSKWKLGDKIPHGYEMTAHGRLVKKTPGAGQANDGVGGLGSLERFKRKQAVKEYGPQGTAGAGGLKTTSTQINTSTNKNTPEQDKAEQEAIAKIKKNPGNPLNRDFQALLQKAKNLPQ
ncbi:MAG: hypothetical protein N2235_03085 [Fischerella sp.]|nr:hypothetical protein [Fischerella sp.]